MRAVFAALLAACVPIVAHAQATPSAAQTAPTPSFVRAEAEAAVRELAAKLEDNFVFPDTGRAYAAALRTNLGAGKYASFADAEAFAEAVTADLQAVHKDGHLRLFAPKVPGAKSKYRTAPSSDGAMGKSGWIGEGVAYLELKMFPSDKETLDRLRNFLDSHSSAKTLIIDIRGHHGGDISEIDLLASYVFAEPAVLAHLDTRRAVDEAGMAPFADGPTLRRIASPDTLVRREHHVVPASAKTGLRSAKLILLTSRKTVSAAEHLAMTLKRTGRATLVGETTKGAGHFGNVYKLPGGYTAFIPVGRSFDPDTGQGWEGTGVTPHVAVPADKALDEALKLAGVDKAAEAALATLK